MRAYKDKAQQKIYRTMTLAVYRAFDREYPGEWIDNEDAMAALADYLEVSLDEQVDVAGVMTSKVGYRFRWAQQWAKDEGHIVRDTSSENNGRWRLNREHQHVQTATSGE